MITDLNKYATEKESGKVRDGLYNIICNYINVLEAEPDIKKVRYLLSSFVDVFTDIRSGIDMGFEELDRYIEEREKRGY